MRLTNRHREAIRTAVIGDRFERRVEAITARSQKLARRVYEQAITEQHRAAIQSLPFNFFPHKSSISVKFGAAYTHLPLDEKVPIPYEMHRDTFAVYFPRHEFTQEYEAIVRDKDKLRVEERELRTNIDAVLDSVTTDNRLIDEWPEIEKIVRRIVKPNARFLPAVQMDKLNKDLGLVEDEARV